MSATLSVISMSTPAPIAAVGIALRELVDSADRSDRDRADRASGPRTWAVLGDMQTAPELSENERVVEHDRIGRLAVRLAVDKILCVGDSRSVRALHQGAVMEGSWGDEARLLAADEAVSALLAPEHADEVDWTPRPGDTVLLAAPGLPVEQLVQTWQERYGDAVVTRRAAEEV